MMVLVTTAVFIINIPFGMWREGSRKFSLPWFLAIHLPIPIVVILRISTGLGFSLHSYVFLISAFFLGQFTGGKLRRMMGNGKLKTEN